MRSMSRLLHRGERWRGPSLEGVGEAAALANALDVLTRHPKEGTPMNLRSTSRRFMGAALATAAAAAVCAGGAQAAPASTDAQQATQTQSCFFDCLGDVLGDALDTAGNAIGGVISDATSGLPCGLGGSCTVVGTGPAPAPPAPTPAPAPAPAVGISQKPIGALFKPKPFVPAKPIEV